MKKNIYTIFLLFLLVEVSYSQGIVPTYSFAHVTKDFDYYINTLKTKHPNLYAFVSEDYFNNEVEQARSMLTDSMNVVDLWKTMYNWMLSAETGELDPENTKYETMKKSL